MDLFQVAAALLSLAAIFSYLNHRVLRLPTTIGLMLIAMALALSIPGKLGRGSLTARLGALARAPPAPASAGRAGQRRR